MLTLDPISVNYLFVTYSDTDHSIYAIDLEIKISKPCSGSGWTPNLSQPPPIHAIG
jgi:hypothetical protein